MANLSTVANNLRWLATTIHFFKKHFGVILSLSLIAGAGRVIQLGGFGAITSWMNILLEVVIESARILLFLYVLGVASIKNGVVRIGHFIGRRESRSRFWSAAKLRMKGEWVAVILNLACFLGIAGALNYGIDLLAYETCLYLTLKQDGILAATSSEWTILLFFKNLSVIPLMLIFDAVFLLWITNTLHTALPVTSE